MNADRYYLRTAAVLCPREMAARSVAVIGVGSGGARVAEELARVGVGTITLVDRPGEVLEEHNLVRHPLGYAALGRAKNAAMRDRLLDINPSLAVQVVDCDVSQDAELLASLVRGRDLVALCTDSEPSKHAVNMAVVRAGVPMVYAGVFDGGCGGEIGRYLPGQACYACLCTVLNRRNRYVDQEVPVDYSSADPGGERSTSALNIDIAQVTLLQARFALRTLLHPGGDDRELPGNYLVVGNRTVPGLFTHVLDHEFMHIPRQPGCLVCQATSGRDVDEEYAALVGGIRTRHPQEG